MAKPLELFRLPGIVSNLSSKAEIKQPLSIVQLLLRVLISCFSLFCRSLTWTNVGTLNTTVFSIVVKFVIGGRWSRCSSGHCILDNKHRGLALLSYDLATRSPVPDTTKPKHYHPTSPGVLRCLGL